MASSSPSDGGGAALRQGGPLGSKVLWEAGAGSPKALHKLSLTAKAEMGAEQGLSVLLAKH